MRSVVFGRLEAVFFCVFNVFDPFSFDGPHHWVTPPMAEPDWFVAEPNASLPELVVWGSPQTWGPELLLGQRKKSFGISSCLQEANDVMVLPPFWYHLWQND